MEMFCQDRDLLCLEPVVFIGHCLGGQVVAAGAGASIAAGRLASAQPMAVASIQPGMVLTAWNTAASEGSAYEILAAESPTHLSLSVLRADRTSAAVAPLDWANVSFQVRTYGAQIAAISRQLSEKLRPVAQSMGVLAADFVESGQLRMLTAYGVLAALFMARASAGLDSDINRVKAMHYQEFFRSHQAGLRLAADVDGDGVAERTAALGNVSLRRV